MEFGCQDADTYTKGDLVSLESGEIDVSVTDDPGILGVCLETGVATGVATTGTAMKVVVDEDAIYGVYDASARLKGAQLDIAGTTGAMTVATDSNHDLQVYAPSSATEETLVCIVHGAHPDNITKTA
jgi:hypothetical protein